MHTESKKQGTVLVPKISLNVDWF